MSTANAEQNISTTAQTRKPLQMWELICLVGGIMALNASAIDIMLPALGQMQDYFGFADDNRRQDVVVYYLMGMGISQLFYGPVIDRFGRRIVLWFSLAIYLITTLACVYASSYEFLLWARIIQGAASGAMRVAITAVVRDVYAGRDMARLMSLAVLIFMVAPIIAPSMGLALLKTFGDWHSIFWALIIFGILLSAWIAIRVPETLPDARRIPLNFQSIFRSYKTVCCHKVAMGYSLSSALIFGSIFSYISASEQIYLDVYKVGDSFPLWMGLGAMFSAFSTLGNAVLVKKFGMRHLAHTGIIGMIIGHSVFFILAPEGIAPFALFFVSITLSLTMIGFLGPNSSAMALEPLGHVAGSASAIYGFMTTFIAAFVGGLIADQFQGNPATILMGNLIALILALVCMLWAEDWKLFQKKSD